MAKICKKCGRRITNQHQPGYAAGYGPVCWEKTGKYVTQTAHGELNALRAEVLELRKIVNELKAARFTAPPQQVSALPAVPNGNGGGSKIAILAGGWDVSELKDNALFLKMKELAEVA